MVMTDRLPIEKSYGGDNTYCVGCDVYNGRRHYAVCLRIITRKEENNPHTWEPDCNRAIAGRSCPALALREQEENAGYALYYTPRDLDRFQKVGGETIFTRSYQRGWGSLDKVSRNTVAPAPQQPVKKSKPKRATKKTGSTGSMHADLVNKLMEEETKRGKQSKGSGTDTDTP